MSLKRFCVFVVIWLLACVFIIEPTFIAPLFEHTSALELAFNAYQSDTKQSIFVTSPSPALESMDHFRVLCLLYLVVPALVFVGGNLESL